MSGWRLTSGSIGGVDGLLNVSVLVLTCSVNLCLGPIRLPGGDHLFRLVIVLKVLTGWRQP